MRTLTPTIRWTLLVLAIFVIVMVAFLGQLGGPRDERRAAPAADGQVAAPVDGAALAAERARANLPPCPAGGTGPGPAALRGVVVACAADGTQVDVARMLAGGRPVVLNLWAYWCGPCADELPAMAAYQQRVGSARSVITVHQDDNEGAGLARLAELGVALPTLQDGSRRIAAALGLPNVMPETVVLRADGTVAAILPRAFSTADEIAAAVDEALR